MRSTPRSLRSLLPARRARILLTMLALASLAVLVPVSEPGCGAPGRPVIFGQRGRAGL